MGEGNFWPQQNPHSLTDHKKFVASDYVGDPYGCAKFGANPSTGGGGGFCANGWNITKILFICAFFISWWLKRCGLVQECVFWGFRWYCCPFWGWYTPDVIIWTCARMCLLGVSLILRVIHAWRKVQIFKFCQILYDRSPPSSESKNCFNILCNYTMTLHNFDNKTANINTKNCSLSHRLVSDWLKMNMCV